MRDVSNGQAIQKLHFGDIRHSYAWRDGVTLYCCFRTFANYRQRRLTMTTDLETQFSTDDGEKNYFQPIADLIRAERHDLAKDTLIADLASLHVPLAELCLETQNDVIDLKDWDRLQQMIFRRTSKRVLCTAVGLDLCCNQGGHITPEGWVEPNVQVAFYSDDSFPFSARSREEILAENASYNRKSHVPWHGCMNDIQMFDMPVVGLARLNDAVERDNQLYTRRCPPADYVAWRLAEWFRALRYHQTVKRYLDQEGLARRLPVIVGSYHSPFLEAVYFPAPSRRSAKETEARLASTIEAQNREWRVEQERKLWETADTVREMRKAIRATRFWPSREMRLVRSMYESQEAIIAKASKLGLPRRPSWRIADDAEFEQFLKHFYVDPFL